MAQDFIKLIGNTPLIRLNGPSEETGCEILGKAEFLNPGGSVKDRAAWYIVKDAIEKGELLPGGTIVEGTAGKACVSCHESPEVFKGLRASMPIVNGAGELETIPELVNGCRTERMGAEKWKWSGGSMAGIVGLIGLQSRGMSVDVTIDGPASSIWEKGKELYYTRVGQLNMSCANCHEDNYGNMIRADHLSMGQIISLVFIMIGTIIFYLKNENSNALYLIDANTPGLSINSFNTKKTSGKLNLRFPYL